MNFEKATFGFLAIAALALNAGFVAGDPADPARHSLLVFFLMGVVNLVATGIKLGDRSHFGAMLLAGELVADLLLLIAAVIWTWAVHVGEAGLTPETMMTIVDLALGALVANAVVVGMVVGETLMLRR